jgi:hypothetical protein
MWKIQRYAFASQFARTTSSTWLFSRGDMPMPTFSKAQLTESETPWLETWDRMYRDLCQNRGPILTALGFYAEHDLPAPGANPADILTEGEEAELRPIASALTVAAAASEAMTSAILIATLKRISKTPSLFFSGQLPAAVEWIIACNYQRGDEKPATHWRDVWGDQPALFEGQVETPTEANITRAATSAIRRLQNLQKRGRPYNPANRILADGLGVIFRSSGQLIVRRREPYMRHGELAFAEVGPFYDFLNLVLPPLQRHLAERALAPVTVDTIVRLVTEDFPASRQAAH